MKTRFFNNLFIVFLWIVYLPVLSFARGKENVSQQNPAEVFQKDTIQLLSNIYELSINKLLNNTNK